MPFKALGLDANILQAIADAGYTEPTPIQAGAIPPIIAGSDLIGIAQTGTGKTAAFTLPILHLLGKAFSHPDGKRKTRVLVLAPTRELVAQIEENVIGYAKHMPQLRIAKVYGGVGENPQKAALRSGCEIVIACPGRLLDLMSQGCTDFSGITHLVLDEADRMLDMGFLPDIKRIVAKLPARRQTLMFSATFSKEIEQLTHEFQRTPKIIQIGKRANPAETVTQMVYEVPKHLKLELLKHLLLKDNELNMVIVFVRTKHGADKIAKKLEQSGIKCGTLHSNRSQAQRLRALGDFKAWRLRVLVATDIAARGIDVDGISHVINFDFPAQNEDYVHRIGRTGRALAIGDAISFVSQDEYQDLKSLERFIGRGLIRKRAEGFNYAADAPVDQPPPWKEKRDQERPQHNRRQGPRHRPGDERRTRNGERSIAPSSGAKPSSKPGSEPARSWRGTAGRVFGKIKSAMGGGDRPSK